MRDADRFVVDNPGVKLNEFIEEEVDVRTLTPVPDEKNKRVKLEYGSVKAKQKTMYVDSPSKKVICRPGTHFFVPLDPKKYTFSCRNCDWCYHAQIPTHKYNPEDGSLSYRRTGLKVQ